MQSCGKSKVWAQRLSTLLSSWCTIAVEVLADTVPRE